MYVDPANYYICIIQHDVLYTNQTKQTELAETNCINSVYNACKAYLLIGFGVRSLVNLCLYLIGMISINTYTMFTYW